MRRRLGGAAVLLALALLGLAQGGPHDARAEETCTWQRHSKRLVKHMRRHGRVRRVVRWRRWWSCVPVPGAAVPVPAPGPSPEENEPAPEPEANRLGVKASEYYFVLSRPKVGAGEVVIELNNQGQDAHDLNLEREGGGEGPLEVGETQSLQRTVARFDLPAGTYRLWCSLPEHEEKGMHTTLVVE